MRRALAILFAATAASCAPSKGPGDVRVAAASSLNEVTTFAAVSFGVHHMGTRVSMTFGASSTISRQIESGAPIDVFLSADAENVDRLGAKIDRSTRRVFLVNRLALVVPADAKGEGLAAIPPGSKIAVAGPEVPSGKAWRRYLREKGVLAGLEGRLVVADNVRAALELFESGAADAALVFATDARVAKRARRAWQPPDGPAVEYVAAAVAGRGPLAAEFVESLLGPEFRKHAVEAGFEAPPK